MKKYLAGFVGGTVVLLLIQQFGTGHLFKVSHVIGIIGAAMASYKFVGDWDKK